MLRIVGRQAGDLIEDVRGEGRGLVLHHSPEVVFPSCKTPCIFEYREIDRSERNVRTLGNSCFIRKQESTSRAALEDVRSHMLLFLSLETVPQDLQSIGASRNRFWNWASSAQLSESSMCQQADEQIDWKTAQHWGGGL